MLFNSFEFIFAFLPFVFLGYFFISKRDQSIAKAFLVVSSLFFYAWFKLEYLPIILASMLFNFYFGRLLQQKRDKALLITAILANVALLGYFKYSDFFIENINTLFGSSIGLLNLTLPLAISFFTFQQIAYLVDSYRGEVTKSSFLDYALFVTFFPQLIAGPIVHHKEMMPQFLSSNNKFVNYENIAKGLLIFSIGLFKKVVIADTFAIWANAGFDGAKVLNMVEAWSVSLAYTFQLYFDFSGYTDMAIGAALLFNIKLPINFDSPYKALNIQDFWRRWHITLSRFLKDYIYIPLGGNRVGEIRVYLNLLIVFLVAGIWHGAGWGFVLWGLMHGTALVIYKIWSKYGFKLYKWIAWFITFNFINISWIFFRAKNFDDAFKVLRSMFSIDSIVLPGSLQSKLSFLEEWGISFGGLFSNIGGDYSIPVWIIGAFLGVLLVNNSNMLLKKCDFGFKSLLFIVALFLSSIFSLTQISDFLYFNF